jgi:signal recognition particle receptor subunit beta
MAVINYAGGEINIKIVYYGPGLSGKTTNLEFMHSKLPKENKGKMVSMKTRTDRTLFFDFLPIDVGEINGFKLRFLLYTVPGQVYYNATRKLVLKGVDALVFVADSAPEKMEGNKESIQNLEDNLNDLGLTLKSMPWVLQFNKRDLPNCLDRKLMNKELNTMGVPTFEAVATSGAGVYETFEEIARLVFVKMQEELKEVSSDGKARGQSEDPSVYAEVVAKGRSRLRNSEAGESESLIHAENGEEEHESVSEFVDNVLKENEQPHDGVDLGATRGGYEDYGHLVDLNDEVEKKDSDTQGNMEIISDPLEKFGKKLPATETLTEERPKSVEAPKPLEKVIRIPVRITESEIGKEIPVKVILEVKVESH